MKNSKNVSPLLLHLAEPMDDGGRKLNVIYWVSGTAALIAMIALGANFLGWCFGLAAGLCVGWLIKNRVLDINCFVFRRIEFVLPYRIPYGDLITALIPVLTPLGMQIEKSEEDSRPTITYQGIIYEIYFDADRDVFTIWWRRNIARAFFTVDSIKVYRKVSIAMGIIGYEIQQACQKAMQSKDGPIAWEAEKSKDGAGLEETEKSRDDARPQESEIKNVKMNSSFPNEKKPIGKLKIIGIVALAIVGLLARGTVYQKMQDNQYIEMIKNGSPEAYPNITYGEAFEAFFDKPSWKYFQSDETEDVVEFAGDCMYADTEVTCTIQFVLDTENGTFDVAYLGMNDVAQNQHMMYAIVTKVFKDYQIGLNDSSLDNVALGADDTDTQNTDAQNADTQNVDTQNTAQQTSDAENASQGDAAEDHTGEFVGNWVDQYSQRCGMTIECYDGVNYTIEMDWSSGASYNTHRILHGKYDTELNAISYTDGRCYDEYWDENDNCGSEDNYTDGSGIFYIGDDGYLYWDDYVEDAGAECYFERH